MVCCELPRNDADAPLLQVLHDGAARRCSAEGCASAPLTAVVDRCRGHLADLDVRTLTWLAAEHGADRRRTMNFEWPRIEGDDLARLLVKAARGASTAVADAYVHAAFEDPEEIDALYVNDADNRAVREAMGRERVRLAG